MTLVFRDRNAGRRVIAALFFALTPRFRAFSMRCFAFLQGSKIRADLVAEVVCFSEPRRPEGVDSSCLGYVASYRAGRCPARTRSSGRLLFGIATFFGVAAHRRIPHLDDSRGLHQTHCYGKGLRIHWKWAAGRISGPMSRWVRSDTASCDTRHEDCPADDRTAQDALLDVVGNFQVPRYFHKDGPGRFSIRKKIAWDLCRCSANPWRNSNSLPNLVLRRGRNR